MKFKLHGWVHRIAPRTKFQLNDERSLLTKTYSWFERLGSNCEFLALGIPTEDFGLVVVTGDELQRFADFIESIGEETYERRKLSTIETFVFRFSAQQPDLIVRKTTRFGDESIDALEHWQGPQGQLEIEVQMRNWIAESLFEEVNSIMR